MSDSSTRSPGGPPPTVLLVDDNPTNLKVLYEILGAQGYELRVAKDGESALEIVKRTNPALVLLDIMMPPGIDGYEVCRRLKADGATRDVAVIFLSALDETEDKVKGFEVGAVDYISKPFEAEEVIARVETHMTVQRLQRQLLERNDALEHELRVAQALSQDARERLEGPLMGQSAAVIGLGEAIEKYSAGDAPLLIVGGPGAGEEAVARAVHHRSPRSSRPFLRVNCLGVTEETAGEIFGDEASEHRGGASKWALANGGTIYFERVESLPVAPQNELFDRVEKSREERAAGLDPSADVRVILQTLQDPALPSSSTQRLSRVGILCGDAKINIPSLADRAEDIPDLVSYFLDRMTLRLGRAISGISPPSLERMQSYPWPGNIDELRSVIECAIMTSPGPALEVDPALLDVGGRVGHYQLVSKLGAGGMGEVWLAQHRMLVRPAAVKLIIASELKNAKQREEAMTRFEREARVTAGLESPNTVRLYDFGITDDGSFYYVMELLQGLDLDNLVESYGAVPVDRSVHFLMQACGSLSEAHAARLIHRDIKPANLFACKLGHEFDVVKVLDFGMVRESFTSGSLDLTGASIMGTPMFLSPEVATGKETDSRADLYALGCVAFWLLTGQDVFDADNLLAIINMHATEPPRRPSTVAPQAVPPELDEIVLACLEKSPDARPATASELRDRLAATGIAQAWTRERAEEWWREHRPNIAGGPIR